MIIGYTVTSKTGGYKVDLIQPLTGDRRYWRKILRHMESIITGHAVDVKLWIRET